MAKTTASTPRAKAEAHPNTATTKQIEAGMAGTGASSHG